MKYISFLLVFIFLFLAACQNIETAPQFIVENHTGCAETEIDVNGNCVPKQNAELFNQNLDQFVDYQQVSNGFLAKPKTAGDYPGILMIHEWWGLNDNIKEYAKLLAKEGYVVFAIDLYDGQVANDSNKARELSTSVRNNQQLAIQKMENAVDYLKQQQNTEKIASLGWCFGGGQSLQLSLNEPLDATVIYYGTLTNDTQQLQNIDSPVLGIFGENDTSIPVSSVQSFKSSLDQLNIENEIYIYSGVGHAFANPSGDNYAKQETVDAWQKTVTFLNKNLKQNENQNVQDQSAQNLKQFSLTGVNFRFRMGDVENPELKVKQGDKVRIDFTSAQGFHDFVIDEFSASTQQVMTGNSTFVEFIADKKGTFEYYCSVGQHRQNGMRGNLIVE